MQKSAKYIVIKGIVVMIVVALAGFLLFNGIGRHPYTYDELESVFRAKAAEQNVTGHGGEQLVSEEYGPFRYGFLLIKPDSETPL